MADILATSPEALVGGAVTEDEKEADDDGQTGSYGAGDSETNVQALVEVDNEGGEEGIENYGADNRSVNRALNESQC